MKNLPEVCDVVTIKNIATNDRSYTDDLWRVTAVNETHANLRAVKRRRLSQEIVVCLREYEFSDAESFMVDPRQFCRNLCCPCISE